jgi:AcrR family transcriptional regulator
MAKDANGEKRPELREAVFQSATRMFLDRPYEEVRIDDIAADAGVAKGLAFYYFKNKRGLYVAVVRALLIEMAMRSIPDPKLPPRQREIAAVGAFVEWAAETEGIEYIFSAWSTEAGAEGVFRDAADQVVSQTVAAMGDFPGGPGRADEVPMALLRRSIWGWMAFARIVTADWLRQRDIEQEELRDLLVGALDGVVIAARSVAASAR